MTGWLAVPARTGGPPVVITETEISTPATLTTNFLIMIRIAGLTPRQPAQPAELLLYTYFTMLLLIGSNPWGAPSRRLCIGTDKVPAISETPTGTGAKIHSAEACVPGRRSCGPDWRR
jgi:hypothetical protein